ncbi:MAG TPA: hypothetical protein VG759_26490 [Candidatus Angelobacter sp.]|jgi:hypothetical protein|nr:hypothetical protein [Candidatus Angelobacter sp.]
MHIGYAKGKSSSYQVSWDEYSHEVYIDNGAYYVGKARDSRQAIIMAEAFLAQRGW